MTLALSDTTYNIIIGFSMGISIAFTAATAICFFVETINSDASRRIFNYRKTIYLVLKIWLFVVMVAAPICGAVICGNSFLDSRKIPTSLPTDSKIQAVQFRNVGEVKFILDSDNSNAGE